MFKSERHEKIIEILKENNFASVQQIADRLFVSLPTARRDLTYLEECGYIKRSHGGAMPADRSTDIPLPFRSGTKSREKSRMCRVAASLLKDGSVVFTDASSTVSHLSSYLEELEEVTVVTNGLAMAERLSQSRVKLYVTGGRLLRSSHAFGGRKACEFISDFNAHIMFFSSSSLSESGSITDYSEEETDLRAQMLRNSRTHVFMCDSCKLGKISAFNLCSISDMDYVITDFPLPDSASDSFRLLPATENGIFLYEKK